jgi:hypothetical protein
MTERQKLLEKDIEEIRKAEISIQISDRIDAASDLQTAAVAIYCWDTLNDVQKEALLYMIAEADLDIMTQVVEDLNTQGI